MPALRHDPLMHRTLIGPRPLGAHLTHHPSHVLADLVGLLLVQRLLADQPPPGPIHTRANTPAWQPAIAAPMPSAPSTRIHGA